MMNPNLFSPEGYQVHWEGVPNTIDGSWYVAAELRLGTAIDGAMIPRTITAYITCENEPDAEQVLYMARTVMGKLSAKLDQYRIEASLAYDIFTAAHKTVIRSEYGF